MSVGKIVIGRVRQLPGGSLAIAVGLGTLGISAYLFVLIAGRILGDEKYAPLGALWILVFLIAPGFFFPIEQEISRAVAARRARGEGVAPVVKQAAILTAGLTIALVICALVTSHLLSGQLFNDQPLLTVAFVMALVTYAFQYVARGTFAGNGELSRYGLLIGTEGSVRVLAAGVLAIIGYRTAGPYGLLVGAAPLLSVIVAGWNQRHLLDPGPPAAWKELSSSLGLLIAASLLSQVLVNIAPLVVKYEADANEQDLAGAFTMAVLITRIPLFLFQAIQAVMLPKLTRYATEGNFKRFSMVLREISAVVFGLGVVAVVGTAIFGRFALQLFGSNYPLPTADFILLASGSGLFLLCMTVAQALVALKGQSRTVAGWGAGVVMFIAGLTLPMDIVVRVEVALLVGSAVALGVMTVLLIARLRKVTAAPELVRGEDFNPPELMATEV